MGTLVSSPGAGYGATPSRIGGSCGNREKKLICHCLTKTGAIQYISIYLCTIHVLACLHQLGGHLFSSVCFFVLEDTSLYCRLSLPMQICALNLDFIGYVACPLVSSHFKRREIRLLSCFTKNAKISCVAATTKIRRQRRRTRTITRTTRRTITNMRQKDMR